MKSILLFTWLLATCLANGQTADHVTRSEKILDYFRQEEFTKIREQFDSIYARRVDTTHLRALWTQTQVFGGSFVKITGSSTEQKPQFEIVDVHCQFEKNKIDLRVLFGHNEKIKGVTFIPDLAHYIDPPYLNNDLLEEKTRVIISGDFKMPGTLTIPKTPGRHPAVLLVHGAGANDRDETTGPLKIFKDLAAGLGAQGVVVLRYDKRTRTSPAKIATMKYSMTVKEEVLDDVLSALNVLKADSSVDTTQIFILGHSFGGYLVPRILQEAPLVHGAILLGANSSQLEDVLARQSEYLLLNDTAYKHREDTIESLHRQVARIKSLTEKDRKDSVLLLHFPVSYWLDLKNYDPVKSMMKSRVPVLILQGGRDYQVPQNEFEGWTQGLSNRKNVISKNYPGLNHFFIEGEGKSTLLEYKNPGNLSKEVIDDVSVWIKTGALK